MQKLHPTTGSPEPWLAGRFDGFDVVQRFLCCSLEHSLRDLRIWVQPLTEEQIWQRPFHKGAETDENSIGFQLRHIAGSVDRLITYARGQSLTGEQLAFLRAESAPGASKQELLDAIEAQFEQTAAFAQSVPSSALAEPRFIGRQRLETPLGVLLAHLAEHTQRHTGQTILLAKIAAQTAR